MGRLSEFVKFESGSPQFRIKQSTDTKAPVYTYYSQTDLFDDLSGIISNDDLIKKQIKTNDSVCILAESDLVFSLISGTAAIVRKIKSLYPDFPVLATGGPTEETIRETIEAGANAITYTPPYNGEIMSALMDRYRDK